MKFNTLNQVMLFPFGAAVIFLHFLCTIKESVYLFCLFYN